MTQWQQTWRAVDCELCCFSSRTSSLSSCVFEFFSVWCHFISALLLSSDCFLLSNLQMIEVELQLPLFLCFISHSFYSPVWLCADCLDTFIQKCHTINVLHYVYLSWCIYIFCLTTCEQHISTSRCFSQAQVGKNKSSFLWNWEAQWILIAPPCGVHDLTHLHVVSAALIDPKWREQVRNVESIFSHNSLQ